MAAYQKFLVAPFSEGVDKTLDPWLAPDKAFSKLDNVYIDRGIIKKRQGCRTFGRVTPVKVETIHTSVSPAHQTGTGAPAVLTKIPIVPYSVSIVAGTKTVTDDGAGNIVGDVAAVGGSVVNTINYTTGAFNFDFDAAPGAVVTTATYQYTATGGDSEVRGVHLFDESDGTTTLLAFDKRRAESWNTSTEYFERIGKGTQVTAEAYNTGDGSTGPFTDTIANTPVVPYSVVIYTTGTNQYAFDDGDGNLVGDCSAGTVDYTTGAATVTFNNVVTAPNPILSSYQHTDTLVYDIWNSSNLIQGMGWWDHFFINDDVSNMTIYDGSNIVDIAFRLQINSARTTVDSALMVFPFYGRLIMLNTVENAVRAPQRCRYSAVGNPLASTAWREDTAGKGGFVDAATNEEIVSAMPLKDRIIVWFERSVWSLGYTGNTVLPFIWEKLNSRFECNSTFGSFTLDDVVVGLGKYDLIATDGRTVKKFNDKLPDFPLNIDYDIINESYGFMVSKKNQTWLAYPENVPDVDYPNKVLIYNFDDDIFSQYEFSDVDGAVMETRCFGEYEQQADVSYTDLYNAKYWDEISASAEYNDYANYTYIEVGRQSGDPLLLCGSKNGYVYDVDSQFAVTDNTYEYNIDIITKRYNPYDQEGRKVYLGYIDFLLTVNADVEIDVEFFLGYTDDATANITKKITLTSQDTGLKVWKRVYAGFQADAIQFRITNPDPDDPTVDEDARKKPFELHAFEMHMKPGGRLL